MFGVLVVLFILLVVIATQQGVGSAGSGPHGTAVGGVAPSGSTASNSLPPYIDIVSANIVEEPPVELGNPVGRTVVLQIGLAGPPSCGSTSSPTYGFLVDSDDSNLTGLSGIPFEPLGVDARLSASCDPATGLFSSPLGVVTTGTNQTTGSFFVDINSTEGKLPSLDFHWIAFAQDGTLFSRLPAEGNYSSFETIEEALF